MTDYLAEDFTFPIAAADYVARFRDAGRFIDCCRACPNYGRSWGCPPFGYDVAELLGGYRSLLLIATKITPQRPGLPLSASQELIRPERIRLEKRLRELERRYGGRACAYIGECLYCPAGECTRSAGLACRHPELVRPSLEAYGFDIGRTLDELFGIELRWGRDGRMPDYLTLVCGFFHNAPYVLGWGD